MNRRNVLLGLMAALPLAVFGWASRPAADAATLANAKQSLGCGCCCEDPTCPPGCDANCPPDCDLLCLQDCCSGPACPPSCDANYRPNCTPCCPSSAGSAETKQAAVKRDCGPNACCALACDVALNAAACSICP